MVVDSGFGAMVVGGGSSGAPLPTMLVGDASGPGVDVVPAPGFVPLGSDETGPDGASVVVVSSVSTTGRVSVGALGRVVAALVAGSADETTPGTPVELGPGVDALDDAGAATVERSVTMPGSSLVEVSIESEPEHDEATSATAQTHAVSRSLETTDASSAKAPGSLPRA